MSKDLPISTPFLTGKEVADYLHISSATLYRMVESGTLPALKVGAKWRFDVRAIQEWERNATRVVYR